MSATATPPPRSPQFSQDELAMLSKTADALSAYLGKPVLAEVGQSDTGTEWVTFGVPIDEQAETEVDHAHVQLGGPTSRLLGNRGGLPMSDNVTYDCAYLWAIEISVTADERFVKLDHDGEESAWSDDLIDVLPFGLNDDDLLDDDEDDESEDDDEDDITGTGASPLSTDPETHPWGKRRH